MDFENSGEMRIRHWKHPCGICNQIRNPCW